MLRHFLEVDDLTPAELIEVLDLSEAKSPQALAGTSVGLIFEKPSLRTRNSCEVAVAQLGGFPVYISDSEISLDQRETTEDAIRVLAGYFGIIGARVREHSQLERMASVSTVPIVNLLSDTGHPVQALADLLTIRQHLGPISAQKLAWVGDFSNVANSLALGMLMLGGSVTLCCPDGYGPTETDLDRLRLRAEGGAQLTTANKPGEAVVGSSIVSTDAWYSMGQEDERDARRRAFEGFCVTQELMEGARKNAVFLHCLPAHRGEEVTDEVLDGPFSRAVEQAHNRLHSIRGLFVFLMNQPSTQAA